MRFASESLGALVASSYRALVSLKVRCVLWIMQFNACIHCCEHDIIRDAEMQMQMQIRQQRLLAFLAPASLVVAHLASTSLAITWF